MENVKKNLKWYVVGLLFVVNVFVWYAVLGEDRGGVLTVAFLDVGQGDAIFIEAPNGNQVLIDGGPNKKVLRELGKVMPFYDRSIDMVIASHPDKDHIGGLTNVLKKFKIGVLVETGIVSGTDVYDVLKNISAEKEVQKIIAKRGERIILDENVYIDILFPDRDTAQWDANTASVVARLVYGDTSFLLTGDSPKRIEEYITSLDGKNLSANVLKLGHHGSRTSTSEFFLGAVDPQYVVISAGADNRYGHPHKEVTDTLKEFEIPSLSTYESGTIIFTSDGEKVRVKL